MFILENGSLAREYAGEKLVIEPWGKDGLRVRSTMRPAFEGEAWALLRRGRLEGEALPMHLEMLTKAGIRLMENIYMEEIVKQKIYEFCLFAAPLKIKGGTASPIRFLALI